MNAEMIYWIMTQMRGFAVLLGFGWGGYSMLLQSLNIKAEEDSKLTLVGALVTGLSFLGLTIWFLVKYIIKKDKEHKQDREASDEKLQKMAKDHFDQWMQLNKETAQKNAEKDRDYILLVKENQKVISENTESNNRLLRGLDENTNATRKLAENVEKNMAATETLSEVIRREILK